MCVRSALARFKEIRDAGEETVLPTQVYKTCPSLSPGWVSQDKNHNVAKLSIFCEFTPPDLQNLYSFAWANAFLVVWFYTLVFLSVKFVISFLSSWQVKKLTQVNKRECAFVAQYSTVPTELGDDLPRASTVASEVLQIPPTGNYFYKTFPGQIQCYIWYFWSWAFATTSLERKNLIEIKCQW